MLTRAPRVRPPSVVRASVSGTASKAITPPSTDTAVRQQPPTATEPPTSVAAAAAGAATSSRIPSGPPETAATFPTSRTIPVNTCQGYRAR